MNSKDKSPIPFATLLIKNKSKGVISNSDGGFKIPFELYKKDTLLISSIGYASKEIAISSLDKSKINLIVLLEQIEQLDEVLLVDAPRKKRKRNAKNIVNLAIKNITNNYSFSPYSYIGYYRDYQIKEKEYLNLNEALLEVFDPGFGVADLKGTQTRIYQNKNNNNFQTDTIAS
ncbi:carboxypeptidase-like regulatory domain-containing protein [Psychroflexus sp. CAK8W]|uniref:Carboxypeptidase-like regulatory domain-containing protein n=1 Tax=Psychroflexus longus TaxID=2873596 RepID=A0ABS7XHX6_9FLAO|nr:carboxypeptidase-like regulatory domain-containing protein [Psychroflexus longus]